MPLVIKAINSSLPFLGKKPNFCRLESKGFLKRILSFKFFKIITLSTTVKLNEYWNHCTGNRTGCGCRL